MASQVNFYSPGMKCVSAWCLFLCAELHLSDCRCTVRSLGFVFAIQKKKKNKKRGCVEMDIYI